ncbi:DUF1911 domain-containing protein [Verminephrobacter aporrectodeae]|uniref:DUF1911 domain-containing protein n=1 Tax=Verminephrobacter aporrectodeae TaxID=1110389 RepID=UPI00223854E1|nr:DUF1911 domain-containing protein [Verminephrobacter aporrectodeae]
MMRNPDANADDKVFCDGELESLASRFERTWENENYTDEILVNFHSCIFGEVVDYMKRLYDRGDPLADIWNFFEKKGWPDYLYSAEFIRSRPLPNGELRWAANRLHVGESSSRELLFFITILVCMDHSPERLHNYKNWLNVNLPCRMMDVLIKSFIPGYPYLPKYEVSNYREWWMTPLLDALAQPPEQRPAALAAHMGNWHRLMRPLGWRPKNERKKFYHFRDFAFEVALAVCAYDIDDSSFRDHPHYPRDLVDHYREHIRHTRDAWRAEGVGADVELFPSAPPRRIDLAQSQRKNFARWVELVCDGYDDAVEDVLKTMGTPRQVENFFELLNALQDAGHAIQADIKDDDSLGCQASDLSDARGIGPFEAPASDPPEGPGRCMAILRALAAWVAPRGYRMIDLDDEDDAWHAVLVRAEYHEEFLALSRSLGLRTRTPEQVYED